MFEAERYVLAVILGIFPVGKLCLLRAGWRETEQ